MFKWKEKFLSGLLLLIISIALVGCGGNNQEVAEPIPETDDDAEATGDSLESLTLVGGSAQGLWTVFGEGIGNILRQAYPGTQFSYETGSGVSNIMNVTAGEVPLGLAFNFEINVGREGEEPFPEAVPDVTALASLFNNQPYHMVLSKEFADAHGITSFEDIVEKQPPLRASTLPRGILAETVARTIFEHYGMTYEDINSWGGEIYHENLSTSFDMIRDGRLDYAAAFSFAPDGGVLELTNSKDVVLLPLNSEVQQAIEEEFGTPPGTISVGAYDWLEEDIATNNAALVLIGDPNMSEEEAYLITKALVENIDVINSWHNSLTDLTPEDMADVDRDILHPGALRYYEEVNLID